MRQWLIALLQVAATGAIFWMLVTRIDIAGSWRQIASLAPSAALAVLGLLAVQLGIAAWRLRCVVETLGHAPPLAVCVRANLAGGFVGQTPLSIVGADLIRIWFIRGKYVPLRAAASAIAMDRVFGAVSLLALIGLTIVPLWFMMPVTALRQGLLATIFLVAAGFSALLMLRFLPERTRRSKAMHWIWETATALGRILGAGSDGIVILSLGAAVQILNLLSLYVIARGLDAPLSLYACVVLAPVPLFLSMLPISFGGWGVREAALVTAFELAGVPSHTTLAISVIFGLALLVISLPGGLVLLEHRARA